MNFIFCLLELEGDIKQRYMESGDIRNAVGVELKSNKDNTKESKSLNDKIEKEDSDVEESLVASQSNEANYETPPKNQVFRSLLSQVSPIHLNDRGHVIEGQIHDSGETSNVFRKNFAELGFQPSSQMFNHLPFSNFESLNSNNSGTISNPFISNSTSRTELLDPLEINNNVALTSSTSSSSTVYNRQNNTVTLPIKTSNLSKLDLGHNSELIGINGEKIVLQPIDDMEEDFNDDDENQLEDNPMEIGINDLAAVNEKDVQLVISHIFKPKINEMIHFFNIFLCYIHVFNSLEINIMSKMLKNKIICIRLRKKEILFCHLMNLIKQLLGKK